MMVYSYSLQTLYLRNDFNQQIILPSFNSNFMSFYPILLFPPTLPNLFPSWNLRVAVHSFSMLQALCWECPTIGIQSLVEENV